MRGDPVRVRQILSNFITNALKFTERGQVAIAANATPGGAVRLTVSDTGPGVPPQAQERLFPPFSQGDSSTTRCGMDDFLTKPIDAPKLRQTLVRQLVTRRGARAGSGAAGS